MILCYFFSSLVVRCVDIARDVQSWVLCPAVLWFCFFVDKPSPSDVVVQFLFEALFSLFFPPFFLTNWLDMELGTPSQLYYSWVAFVERSCNIAGI